jgi:hypothetical protein
MAIAFEGGRYLVLDPGGAVVAIRPSYSGALACIRRLLPGWTPNARCGRLRVASHA